METAKKLCTDGIARFTKNLGLAIGLYVKACWKGGSSHGCPQKFFQGCAKSTFCLSFGAYSHNWVWNGSEPLMNTFAVLSLVCAGWTELTSEIFCPNCFLHFACQKCFSFHKLPNIHFWEHFLQISYNLTTINDQINISGERQWNSRKTVANNEKWICILTHKLLKLELTKFNSY